MKQTFKNTKGKVIGSLKDGIYRKKASKKIHYMRVFDGWGIDYRVLIEMKDTCHEIRIMDTDSDNVWSTPFTVFFSNGITKDFGHGQQVFLQRQYWNITNGDTVIQVRRITPQESELSNLRLI